MATQGQWQGQWAGNWAGPTEGAPPGSMSGVASFSITATGTLTAATVQPPALAAEPYSAPDELTVFLARQQREADRIRKQNKVAIALILAAITEGAIE